ncbi:WYL domain-containing protein [Burkholderia semiarida]|uniref:WYL domain-containing protein n=1 Tax=Burkholderia TaxID=32008 RepID=UPI00265E8297|nr:WYL domain-containing protein [Burkholderia sp. AU44665]MDN7698628.1 WYL domain-containing protein [Burkholderia sp. AU44665]
MSTVFGVVLNHVTKDFREYEAAFPQSLIFEPRRRFYVPGPAFKPRFASGDPHEYLALQLASSQIKSSALVSLVGNQLPIQGLPIPTHGVKRQTLSLAVQAIRSGTALEVVYHSMTTIGPVKRRMWPHALIHTGSWWHLRAFDSRSEEFRNFALQRIEQPKALTDPSPQPSDHDLQWHKESVLEVIPHAALNDHQTKVVARDFGMTSDGGQPLWRVKIRNCLVGYFATYYGLDLPNARPPRHILALRNRDEVKALFLPSNHE